MNYKLIRPLLFKLDAERAHHLTLAVLKIVNRIGLFSVDPIDANPVELFGLRFPNRVGLAAGLDKNGDYIDALAGLGFGFIEIGTITPKPQLGNVRPRLFRLPEKEAIINRMGFNNKGVDYLIERVRNKKTKGIVGINIGKNATTPIENALDDYLICLSKVYPYADYITVNISSPNTQGLRRLQGADYLDELLSSLQKEHQRLKDYHHKHVPLLIKIAPDITDTELTQMAQLFVSHQVDGIIATNTTIDRDLIADTALAKEQGGLSGAPLLIKSTDVLNKLKQQLLKANIPLIASGGVMSGSAAKEKMTAGADLVQVYSGLIYKGPELIKECLDSISAAL